MLAAEAYQELPKSLHQSWRELDDPFLTYQTVQERLWTLISSAPACVVPRVRLARLLLSDGDVQQADSVLTSVAETGPGAAELTATRAVIAELKGAVEEAHLLAERAVSMGASWTALFEMQAARALSRGNRQAAGYLELRAFEADPRNTEALQRHMELRGEAFIDPNKHGAANCSLTLLDRQLLLRWLLSTFDDSDSGALGREGQALRACRNWALRQSVPLAKFYNDLLLLGIHTDEEAVARIPAHDYEWDTVTIAGWIESPDQHGEFCAELPDSPPFNGPAPGPGKLWTSPVAHNIRSIFPQLTSISGCAVFLERLRAELSGSSRIVVWLTPAQDANRALIWIGTRQNRQTLLPVQLQLADQEHLAHVLAMADDHEQLNVPLNPIPVSGESPSATVAVSDRIDTLREVLRHEPRNVSVRVRLAAALIQEGHGDDAVWHLQECLLRDPKNSRAHLLLARIARDRGEMEETIGHLNRAAELAPTNTDILHELSDALIQLGDRSRALRLLSKASAKGEEDPDDIARLGQILLRADNLSEAEEHFFQVLQLQPEHPVALAGLGWILAQRDRPVDGANLLRRALKLDPNLADAWCWLGRIFLANGALNNAEPLIRRALSLAPDLAGARCALGVALLERGEYQQAVHELRAASAGHAETGIPLILLADAMAQLSEPDIAAQIIDRARVSLPEQHPARIVIDIIRRSGAQLSAVLPELRWEIFRSCPGAGRLSNGRVDLGRLIFHAVERHQIGDVAAVNEIITSAIHAFAGQLNIHQLLAAMMRSLCDPAAALAMIEQLLNLQPLSTGLMLEKARALINLGEFSAACNVCREILSIEPGQLLVRRELARTLERTGRLDECIEQWQLVLVQQPSDIEAITDCARALGAAGKYRDAEALYLEGLRHSPHNSRLLFGLGAILRARGRPGRAVPILQAAIRQAPADPLLLKALIAALQETGDREAAITYGRQLVRAEPASPVNRRLLAQLLSTANRRDEAILILNEVTAQDPTLDWPHVEQAALLRQTGQLDAAVTALRRAIELNPAQAQTHHELGLVLQELHKHEAAAEAFHQALERDSNRADSLMALAQSLEQLGDDTRALVHYAAVLN